MCRYKESLTGVKWMSFSDDYHPILTCPSVDNAQKAWHVAVSIVLLISRYQNVMLRHNMIS